MLSAFKGLAPRADKPNLVFSKVLWNHHFGEQKGSESDYYTSLDHHQTISDRKTWFRELRKPSPCWIFLAISIDFPSFSIKNSGFRNSKSKFHFFGEKKITVIEKSLKINRATPVDSPRYSVYCLTPPELGERRWKKNRFFFRSRQLQALDL